MNNKSLETNLETRTENLIVRLTPEEKLSIGREAQKAGISISAFIRLLFRNWANGINFNKKDK